MHLCSHMFIVLCMYILPRGGDKLINTVINILPKLFVTHVYNSTV